MNTTLCWFTIDLWNDLGYLRIFGITNELGTTKQLAIASPIILNRPYSSSINLDQPLIPESSSSDDRINLWEVPLTLLLSSYTLRAPPDVVAYGAVLSACERRWQRSVTVLRSMRWGQVQPDLAAW
jgi:hypothetical protein